MGRIREFNESSVLVEAAKIFAKNGYAGSSISELTKATGLLRGSLYSAYYSKAGLFVNCFQHIADSKPEKNELLIDLLIVAMLERVNVDNKVKAVAIEVVTLLEKTTNNKIESIIANRIMSRANFI